MALGNGSNYQNGNYNNQNSSPMVVPTYYSRMRLRNFHTHIDVNFSFWNGTLAASIVDISNGKATELIKINLSPNKAHMLAECVQKIIDNPESSTAYGVDTGSGETRGLFAIGRDTGVPFILIGKVNKDGQFESSQRFIFNSDSNYSLQFSDLESLNFVKDSHENMDLIMLKDLFTDFARSSNGAYAFATQDINRYEAGKLAAMVRGIMQAANASPVYLTNNNNRSGNSNGFFSNANNNNNNGSSNNSYSNNNNNGDNSNNRNNGYQKIDSLEDEFG